LIDASCPVGWKAADLHRRLDHFVREDARIPIAATAFRAGDAVTLRDLSLASQADAEALLGNQIEETVALAAAAHANGALAACSFGAGFGGSVWALVPIAGAVEFARAWHPDTFVARPGPPLLEVNP
jgi:galactokinase